MVYRQILRLERLNCVYNVNFIKKIIHFVQNGCVSQQGKDLDYASKSYQLCANKLEKNGLFW